MSAYKTVTLERTGDGLIEFTPAVLKWNPAAYPANVQLSVDGLNGGVFDVYLLPVGASAYRLVWEGGTEADLVTVAGKDAPMFSVVALDISGTSGATVSAVLTLWERGI